MMRCEMATFFNEVNWQISVLELQSHLCSHGIVPPTTGYNIDI